MVNMKDLATGCLTLVAIGVATTLLPLLALLGKLSILVTLPILALMVTLLVVGLLGKLIRVFFSRNP